MEVKCTSGKYSFDTKQEALVRASQYIRPVKRKGGLDRPFQLKAYKCECGKWHLTKRVR